MLLWSRTSPDDSCSRPIVLYFIKLHLFYAPSQTTHTHSAISDVYFQVYLNSLHPSLCVIKPPYTLLQAVCYLHHCCHYCWINASDLSTHPLLQLLLNSPNFITSTLSLHRHKLEIQLYILGLLHQSPRTFYYLFSLYYSLLALFLNHQQLSLSTDSHSRLSISSDYIHLPP